MILTKQMRQELMNAKAQNALTKKVSTPQTFILGATPRARTQAPKSMESYLNYGMGPQQQFYSTAGTGTMNMSPQPLGEGMASKALASTDNLVGQLGQQLAGLSGRYADGGKVGVSMNALKAIKEALSHLQSKDRARAVQTLRASREAMQNPGIGRSAEEILSPNPAPGIDRLKKMVQADSDSQVPLLADGGQAPTEAMADVDPQALYAEYQQIMKALESGQLGEKEQMDAINRLQEIESTLEAMGIQVGGEQQPEQGGGGDLQGMMSQLQQGAAGLGIQ